MNTPLECRPCLRPLARATRILATISLVLGLSACGGGGGGAEVQAQSQSLTVSATPTLTLQSTAMVSSSASSGLPIRYTSRTPSVCSVDSVSGQVTALSIGTCTITAEQPGNSQFAPASPATITLEVVFDPHQVIEFDVAPTLRLGDTATVSATATSGLAVAYSSATSSVCTVDATSGQVSALLAGTCTILADQAGNSQYLPATQAALSLAVVVPSGMTVPGTPTGVAVKSGHSLAEVVVSASSVDGGGTLITSFTATSSPSGYTASGNSLPLRVSCASTCAGESFTLRATNGVGAGTWSSATHIIDTYDVVDEFYEPDTQPKNSVFVGSFTYDTTTRTVTNLTGRLSESMTGTTAVSYPSDTMTWLDLSHQLASWHDDALGGTFVATFKNDSKNTFWTGLGGDGWSPQAGVNAGGVYFGFPKPANNPGNAYVLIFVPDSPLTPLTPAQINKLAYADCAPGGMMGSACMTGTTIDGYGAFGTMGGEPISQTITRRP